MPSAGRHTFFATCAPGVEPALHAEARALRLSRVESQVGGLRFEGRVEDAWRASFCLRTAVRVLQRLARFPARSSDALYRGVGEIDWRRFLAPGGSLAVSAQSRQSRLDHTRFVEQRTKDAIVDQLRQRTGTRPSVDRERPDLCVHVHLWRDRCTLSIDTSGESLHKRGWRRFPGRAPLAETLAAAVVMLADWDRRAPLVDPFCGSGTILVEAALLALGVPPGTFRESFAFERFPDHDAGSWKRLRRSLEESAGARAPRGKLILRGGDEDAAAARGARRNLEAANLLDRVEIEVADALSWEPRRGWNVWIVTNPPYGERLGDLDRLERLYARFGELLRRRCGGYRLALLSGNPRLADALGHALGHAPALPRMERVELRNGPIRCELLKAEISRR